MHLTVYELKAKIDQNYFIYFVTMHVSLQTKARFIIFITSSFPADLLRYETKSETTLTDRSGTLQNCHAIPTEFLLP